MGGGNKCFTKKKHISLTNIPLVGDTGNREGHVYGQIECIWEISMPAYQFCCQSNTALKKKKALKKWKKERECWG